MGWLRTFLVTALPVLLADEGLQCVVYPGAVWEEDSASGADIVEKEQFLFLLKS
jgi:hypothetical protein